MSAEAEGWLRRMKIRDQVLRKVSRLAILEFKGISRYSHCLTISNAFCLYLGKSQGPLCLWNIPYAHGPTSDHLGHPPVNVILLEVKTAFSILCDSSLCPQQYSAPRNLHHLEGFFLSLPAFLEKNKE